jgi:hypothetical protein
MDASPLAILERAELAARERRLAATAEAEHILAAAAERAAAIEAAVPDRIAAALADLRRTHAERAAAEVQAIERELASLGATPLPGRDDAFSAAVELVVAAVLGERDTGATAESIPPSPVATAPGGGV